MASAVKEIDSYIYDRPASFNNINTIAVTLDGVTDSLLETANTSIDELDQGIPSYDAGTINLEKFETLLDRITSELTSRHIRQNLE
ncbi:MAG: hypothetical protein KC484_13855 [Colwelliaceae bacterium]|nr:hypothetical protein [Colwelliaceae bacterium]